MIGIISAMPEEMEALLNTMCIEQQIEKGNRTYHQGTLYGKSIVLVFSRWGKVAAAATTTQLICDFNPTEIIFTGVAGGIKPYVRIGDVVLGNRLYQHDVDARPFFNLFEIPILRKQYFKTSLRDKLIASTHSFLQNFSNFIPENHMQLFDIQSPEVYIGDIASGDSFISNEQKVSKIRTLLPSVCCVEMEGAAVAQVCYEYNLPFSIIRIISDKANDNSKVDFVQFSEKIASNYALGILKFYLA